MFSVVVNCLVERIKCWTAVVKIVFVWVNSSSSMIYIIAVEKLLGYFYLLISCFSVLLLKKGKGEIKVLIWSGEFSTEAW